MENEGQDGWGKGLKKEEDRGLRQTILRAPMCSLCGAAGAKRGNKRGVTRPVYYACPTKGCPHSTPTELSRFGSTACKSLHRCLDCQEPFDHFKVL